jgi:hypothetical protein
MRPSPLQSVWLRGGETTSDNLSGMRQLLLVIRRSSSCSLLMLVYYTGIQLRTETYVMIAGPNLSALLMIQYGSVSSWSR